METKSLYQFLFFNEQQILFGETALSLGLVANQLILKSHWRFFEYPLCGRTVPGSGTIMVNKTHLIPAFCVLTVSSILAHCGQRVHRAVSCFSITILQYNICLPCLLFICINYTKKKAYYCDKEWIKFVNIHYLSHTWSGLPTFVYYSLKGTKTKESIFTRKQPARWNQVIWGGEDNWFRNKNKHVSCCQQRSRKDKPASLKLSIFCYFFLKWSFSVLKLMLKEIEQWMLTALNGFL